MLEFLNWKLTLSALVVCLLFDVQCAPPTTTRVNLELICNETIAAVSPQDCQSCPVKGCEFELLQAGCWKDSDHWYKSCMGELGPCIKIRWEENNDGSYSNSECRSRCPHLHETCDFMPVLLTTTLKVPIAGPAKIAPADTSMTVGLIIGIVIGSLFAVIIIAVPAVFGIKKLIEKKEEAERAASEESPRPPTDVDPANNIRPSGPPPTENGVTTELTTLGPVAQAVNRQAGEGNEGFEDDPTVTSPLLSTTPSNSSSSIPVDPANNIRPSSGPSATFRDPSSTENAEIIELMPLGSVAQAVNRQAGEGNEGFEDDPTVASQSTPTTPSHSSSSIPVDASGAGLSTASSSSPHPTAAANASSTSESENPTFDSAMVVERPVTQPEDDDIRLEPVQSDNVGEFATPSHEEQIAQDIDQWNVSGSKATTSGVSEGATETNKSEEIGHQQKVEKLAVHLMDNDRNEESCRLPKAAGGSPPVDQHATNSGGAKPSGTIEPVVTGTLPGRTQKHASTDAPTPQDGSPGSSGSSVQTGTKTDNEGRNDASHRLDEAAGGSLPGAQHGAISKKVRPRGGLEMHTITLTEGLLDEAPKSAPSGNKAEKTEGPGATTPDLSQQASATTSQNGSPGTSQNGSTASSPDGSPTTSQNGSTETSPDGSTASSPDGSPNLSRVQPGTKTGGGTKVATKSRRIED